MKARCGGPARCSICSIEYAQLVVEAKSPPLVPNQKGSGCAGCIGKCAYRDKGYCSLHVAPTPTRTIVAFTGLAGSGKSTAAHHLVKSHGFTRVRFAGPLKAMLAALGCTEREVDGDLKETPCDLLGGKTPRHAMQTLGTEWGRDLIASDLWIRAWNAAVAKVPAGVSVVVDDCRFPNEVEAVHALGGMVVRIERPGAGTASVHLSEQHALSADATLHNRYGVDRLHQKIDTLLRDFSWAAA